MAASSIQNQRRPEMVEGTISAKACKEGESKVVRFNEQLATYSNDVLCLDTSDEAAPASDVLWYQKKDIKAFKEQFIAHAKHVARCNRTGQRKIRSGNEVCCECNSPSCARNDNILKVFRACCQEECTEHKALCPEAPLTCFAGSFEWLGLEKMVSRKIATDKSRRRSQLIQKVLQYQECVQASRDAGNGSVLSQEELRRVCEQISLPSRLFAHKLATAVASKMVAKAA
mmetsp:Transcript_17754/g.41503  ORF Transcript_17754/g.41503 Transcript_17754/m.41503 type:complete len:229 (+) Transcript_17754:154-840(+)